MVIMKTFRGGVHPDCAKVSGGCEIVSVNLPPRVVIPLQQHIGAPCEPLVQKGDKVKTGQIIANTGAYVSAPVHSSVTGVVKDINKYYTIIMLCRLYALLPSYSIQHFILTFFPATYYYIYQGIFS